MPELPEVETVRRGLVPVLEGGRIAQVVQRRPDLRWPLPDRMVERLTGQEVLALRRRSKFILGDLASGETLLIHLGMSGRMLISRAPVAPAKHDHVIFDMSSGARVTFNDARRFGAMDLVARDGLEAHPWLAKLGPEPLGNGFSAAYLQLRFEGRRAPVKALLLDQQIVAGLGNIYVSESLHRAGIDPRRGGGLVSEAELERLVAEIRATLSEAIDAGGSSLRDHRRADGELGYFQHQFQVYGREGAHCHRPGCAGIISRFVQSGRSTFACLQCQR